MSTTITMPVELTQIDCGNCGGTYAINERYRQKQQDNCGTWTCPYCKCGWGYSGDTAQARAEKAAKRAQELLAQERERNSRVESNLRDSRDRAERRASAARGQITKIKNRVGHGVCPCCNRTFKQLAAHMASKHPEYAAEKNA